MSRRYRRKSAMEQAEENLDAYRRFVSDSDLELMFDELKVALDAEEDEINDEWF